MTRHVMLNNVDHGSLRVREDFAAAFGCETHAVPTFPTEYADVQREYPILFRRDPASAELQSIALLGFEAGENLFLENGTWRGSYVPALLARGPFAIGFQPQEVDGEPRMEPVIHVDLDDPRVGGTDGHPVFLEHGGHSPYLDRIVRTLRCIQDGIAASTAMFEMFQKFALLAPVNLQIDFHTDEQTIVTGLSTIDQQRLEELDGPCLEELNRGGFLGAAFLVVASLGNVSRMIDMKNRRSAARRQQT